jgi:hypothetical protein
MSAFSLVQIDADKGISNTIPTCIQKIIQNHRFYQSQISELEFELRETKQKITEYKCSLKQETQVLELMPAVMSTLPIACTLEEMKKMLKYKNLIHNAGGIEEVKKMIKICEDADERARNNNECCIEEKNLERNKINQKYKAFIDNLNLPAGRVYVIKWESLTSLHTGLSLCDVYSFVTLLPSCETKSQNANADPNMLHLKLPFVDGIKELYVNHVDGMMRQVTHENVVSLCGEVFDDKNVSALYASKNDCSCVDAQSECRLYKNKLIFYSINMLSQMLPKFNPYSSDIACVAGLPQQRKRKHCNYFEK